MPRGGGILRAVVALAVIINADFVSVLLVIERKF